MALFSVIDPVELMKVLFNCPDASMVTKASSQNVSKRVPNFKSFQEKLHRFDPLAREEQISSETSQLKKNPSHFCYKSCSDYRPLSNKNRFQNIITDRGPKMLVQYNVV